MELRFYRHKEHKHLYLARTNAIGGSEKTEFYRAVTDVVTAILSVIQEEKKGNNFLGWLHNFPENCVTTTLEKEMEFDGYHGTLRKEIKLPVSEFELVTLVEKE
jgi:hypothetical protein